MNSQHLDYNVIERQSKLEYSKSDSRYNELLTDHISENRLLKLEVQKLHRDYEKLLNNQMKLINEEQAFLDNAEKNYLNLKQLFDDQAVELKRLKEEYRSLKQSYNSLRNSKFGRIAMKYWSISKSIRKRVGK